MADRTDKNGKIGKNGERTGRALRRALGVAAIWLALIVAVFAYTDPDEYAWRFDGDDVAQVVESEDEAQAKQQAASEEMDKLRWEAAARTATGEWGRESMFEDPLFMDPVEPGYPGLNLMWGTYEVELAYASAEDASVRVAACARQALVSGGETPLPAAPEGGNARFTFELTGAAPGVMLAASLPEGARIDAVSVKKAGTGVFSADLAAYAALLGAVLTGLYVLSWDERRGARERRRDAMLLLGAALFASMPSLWYGMIEGHDLYFHLNRIEGIASGLRAGEFPVRIHSSTLMGYGYAAPEFYSDLFLYGPAVLRNLGVSQATCVRLYQMALNLAAAFVTFLCAKRLFRSRRVAMGAALLYTLSVYRVVNLYVRGSLGESTAMIFFPLLVSAMADVIAGDEKRWPLLTLGVFGVFMNHMLSTLFALAFLTLGALLGAGRLIREPRRILAIVKAALLTVVCSLWFLVPFLDFTAAGVSTNVVAASYMNELSLGSLLVAFAGNPCGPQEADVDYAYHIGVVPGIALLAGAGILLARLYADGRRRGVRLSMEDEPGREKLAALLLAIGAFAALCSTELFPWAWACSLPRPLSTVFMQVQFPWRLISVASPLLALAAAYGYVGDERHAASGMALLCALAVVTCGYTTSMHVRYERALMPSVYCDTRISQFEYTYMGTEKEALECGRITVFGLPADVLEYERDGSSLYARVHVEIPYVDFEVPILYYPHYRATINGVEKSVKPGTNNVLRIYDMDRPADAEIRVWFEPPVAWRVAEAASAAGIALLLALLLGVRRRARAA